MRGGGVIRIQQSLRGGRVNSIVTQPQPKASFRDFQCLLTRESTSCLLKISSLKSKFDKKYSEGGIVLRRFSQRLIVPPNFFVRFFCILSLKPLSIFHTRYWKKHVKVLLPKNCNQILYNLPGDYKLLVILSWTYLLPKWILVQDSVPPLTELRT